MPCCAVPCRAVGAGATGAEEQGSGQAGSSGALGTPHMGCGAGSGHLPRPRFPFWQGYKGGVGREGSAAAQRCGAARMGAQTLAGACRVLALCLAFARATNPGFVVRITQAGLDYGGFGV